MQNVIYFEVNNREAGKDYPNEEPFVSWFAEGADSKLNDFEWAKDNRICVVYSKVGSALDYCVTAKKSWVIENCPNLLTKYRKFLRYPDEFGDVLGKSGCLFLDYDEFNFGVLFMEDVMGF